MRKILLMFVVLLSLLFINGCVPAGSIAGTYVTCDYCTSFPCRLYTRVYGGVNTYCIEQSNELGSGCPTTASIPWVQIDTCTTSNPTICTDSDGGEIITIKGKVTDKSGAIRTDSCYSTTQVNEYICDTDGLFSLVLRTCAQGATCSDGACSGIIQCLDADTGESRPLGYKYCRWNYPQTEYTYECMSNGQWSTQACSANCNDATGTCYTGECVPGLYKNEICQSGTILKYDYCGSDRYWDIGLTKDCSIDGKICQDGQCVQSKVLCPVSEWTSPNCPATGKCQELTTDFYSSNPQYDCKSFDLLDCKQRESSDACGGCFNECFSNTGGCEGTYTKWECGENDNDECLDKIYTECEEGYECKDKECVGTGTEKNLQIPLTKNEFEQATPKAILASSCNFGTECAKREGYTVTCLSTSEIVSINKEAWDKEKSWWCSLTPADISIGGILKLVGYVLGTGYYCESQEPPKGTCRATLEGGEGIDLCSWTSWSPTIKGTSQCTSAYIIIVGGFIAIMIFLSLLPKR